MNVYRSLRSILGGHNTDISIVDNGKAMTITPSVKPTVPLGFLGLTGLIQYAVIPDSDDGYADVTVRVPIAGLVKKRVQLS